MGSGRVPFRILKHSKRSGPYLDRGLPKPPPCLPPEEPRPLPPVEGFDRVRPPPLNPLDEPDEEPELGCHPESPDDGRVRERPPKTPRERPAGRLPTPVPGRGLGRGRVTMPTPCGDRSPSRVSTGPVPARPSETDRVAPVGVLWMTVVDRLGAKVTLRPRAVGAGRATVGRLGTLRETGTARPLR